MERLEKLLNDLINMKHDLFDNYRIDLKERFEIVGDFMQEKLENAIECVDEAVDRIEELEKELKEANDRIEELEA